MGLGLGELVVDDLNWDDGYGVRDGDSCRGGG